MNREILKKFQEMALARGIKLSQEDIKELFHALEDTIMDVADELDVGERATVGCVVVEKQETKERVVKNFLDDADGEEYVVPAKEIVKIRGKKSTLEKLKRNK